MPFDEFPTEIIQRVFRSCCGSVAFRVPHKPFIKRLGPTQITLSLVCSRWRAIALETSSLWNDVMVYYDACTSPAPRPSSFQFVKRWLKRAGMTPISLSISVYQATEESEIDAVSQALLESSFHITNLEIESVECNYFLLPTDNSHYLERLHLTWDELTVPIDAFPLLPEMPSLKEFRLSLDLDFFRDLTGIYLIPWHQLRVLSLGDNPWPPQMLFIILHLCKSLVECTLMVELQSQQFEHDIVLPDLKSLVLKIDLKGSADPLIRALTLPNLRSLNIESSFEITKLSLSPEAIVMMAHRSGFKRLTDFSLCETKQPIDVRSLLGSMPALERVKLNGPLMFRPGTFDDLSSGTIGPQLDEMRLGVMNDEEIGLLLETVGHRHEKAKTVSDIRPFAFVAGHCTREGDFESHNQRAKQCSEEFNAHVAILYNPRGVSRSF